MIPNYSHQKVWLETHPDEPLDTADYVIHHINGDHNDNRPENLQRMTRAEHTSLHQKGVSRPSPMEGRNHSEDTKKKIGEKNRQAWCRDDGSRAEQLARARANSKKDPITGMFS